ncbi:PP2C family serine/threonine-protein phosphatase [Kamptonema sp. UHCC 0994]|uniref:PP2C family serine/threonine-protein phosphatase n=1 Tax=Kamptonema sp. UHCC 0994 TaxID=3031329 RepID=UPI0023B97E83|nr:PP2C family serine/threonine-protein phosphatase [Kamptonema sp. UHCC 0994]MDF0552125.1 PP2C family serine/threonine-protein phosphatase [Kamptonema sp. UHCC 0994]
MTEDKEQIIKCQIVAASVMGTSHEKRSQPCQDAHRWKLLTGGILVAAVADGAGSATLAEVGAQIAVTASVEAISQNQQTWFEDDSSWHQLLTEALKTAREAVEAEAKVREVRARDLASTLILAIATPSLLAVAQIGDGAAVVGDSEGNVIAVTVPPCGEYINETIFLISDNALETAQLQVWRGKLTHLALFSDGLQMLALKMPEGTPHVPFFSPLFRFAAQIEDEIEAKQQLESFLRSPRVTERTDDDLTLLLASFSS